MGVGVVWVWFWECIYEIWRGIWDVCAWGWVYVWNMGEVNLGYVNLVWGCKGAGFMENGLKVWVWT